MKKYLLIMIMLNLSSPLLAQQSLKLIGRIISAADGTPLAGASVRIKEAATGVSADSSGRFILTTSLKEVTLIVSYLGFQTRELHTVVSLKNPLSIAMQPDASQLKEVVVSTGYQDIPQERATGSFVQLDNAILNRRVSPDILSRLEDVTPGLIFNRGSSANGVHRFSIRGQSTIFANAEPLIVVDNFPYEGDINNINPNDVESITVLKDAAAASIWGARAGNGVVVINTKKGRYRQPVKVSFNSNVNIADKPDLFYQSQLSSADYISIEKRLFEQDFYKNSELYDQLNYSHPALSPVVELLIAERDGKISASEADAQITALGKQDVRNDYEKYLYRSAVQQQYSLNLSGGGELQRYFVSAGYDKDPAALKGNDYDRVTLNASNTYAMLKHKLELTTGLYYTEGRTTRNNPGIISWNYGQALYPYARLADDEGNPLNIIHDYRESYAAAAGTNGLLNWEYNPLEEMAITDNRTKATDYRLNARILYHLLPQLNFQALYQYSRNMTEGRNLQSRNSYYTRNLINQFTQVNPDGSFSYPVPIGSILDQTNSELSGQNIRAQFDFNGKLGSEHQLNAIAGTEMRDNSILNTAYRLYGYDDEHATSKIVDYLSPYRYYPNQLTVNEIYIENKDSRSELSDRYLSWYANAAWTYAGRYTLSGSGRIDQSNLFGVKTNQKGVPLYSFGAAWKLSDESFYKLSWLPDLKLRATYGSNGNVDKTLSAYTTASYSSSYPDTRLPYASIVNPPNPELRWERVKIMNFGLDFGSRNGRITGSLEYYRKKGVDLIGSIPYAPSSGITTFTGNTANTRGQGTDLTLNSVNLEGAFRWESSLMLSTIHEKVTHYELQARAADYLGSGDGLLIGALPLEGKPLFAVYSLPYAGLDPQTGDPQGYLDGQVSKDYEQIYNSVTPKNMIYNGPARPTLFGAFRNTFSWHELSLSFNISYRFGYYFRRRSVVYGNGSSSGILSGRGGHGDYSLRWQQPGDEVFTQVPSEPLEPDVYRDFLYTYSDVLVEKGDHVRLQDLTLGYALGKRQIHGLPFSRVRLYLYANNLGILWKATKSGLDPDYPSATYPPVRSLAFGLKLDW